MAVVDPQTFHSQIPECNIRNGDVNAHSAVGAQEALLLAKQLVGY